MWGVVLHYFFTSNKPLKDPCSTAWNRKNTPVWGAGISIPTSKLIFFQERKKFLKCKLLEHTFSFHHSPPFIDILLDISSCNFWSLSYQNLSPYPFLGKGQLAPTQVDHYAEIPYLFGFNTLYLVFGLHFGHHLDLLGNESFEASGPCLVWPILDGLGYAIFAE